LLVAKFAACFRFYRDILGFSVTWGDEDDNYAAFTDRESKETTLALFRRQAMAEVIGTTHLPSDPPCQDHAMLIIDVENVDATVEELRSRGAQFMSDPQDHPDWGIRSAYLRDPDGTLIEICSGLEPTKWSEALSNGVQKYRGA
jgi:catechol 2,3-dioxygenase-like lactoylglutathione lyase family enzyme